MKRQVNYDTLKYLDDGDVVEQFDRLIVQAVTHCETYGGDAAKRQVILTVNVEPAGDQRMSGNRVRVWATVGFKSPSFRGATYQCELRKNGVAVFDDLAPDIDQQTLNLGKETSDEPEGND